MRGRLRRLGSQETGATALEFALLAAPLVLITFGIIEFGRALFMQQSLSYATDRAARALYIQPDLTAAAIEEIVLDHMFLADPAQLTVVVCVPGATGCAPTSAPEIDGTQARRLTVSYDFRTLAPGLITSVIPLSLDRVVILPE